MQRPTIMKKLIILFALVAVVVAATAGAAMSAGWHPWSSFPSWTNQRLTYEVQSLKFRLADENRNRESLAYQLTVRELRILKCVRAPEGQEQDCVDALGEFGVTDPYLESILP